MELKCGGLRRRGRVPPQCQQHRFLILFAAAWHSNAHGYLSLQVKNFLKRSLAITVY